MDESTSALGRLVNARTPENGGSQPKGLALSGGGIRSATFCFGVIKALAHRKHFLQFDLMSTVSGGGYIGSMVGRMFHEQAPPALKKRERLHSPEGETPDQKANREAEEARLDAEEVLQALANAPLAAKDARRTGLSVEENLGSADTKSFTTWLRANGRYLIPRGAHDTIFAVALYARNVLATHVELALLALTIGSALALINLSAWLAVDVFYAKGLASQPLWLQELIRSITSYPSTIWLFLPVVGFGALVFISTYWALPSTTIDTRRHRVLCLLAILALAVFAGLGFLIPIHPALYKFGVIFLIAGAFGNLLALSSLIDKKPGAIDKAKNRATTRLAQALQVTLILVAIGLVDIAAWKLANLSASIQTATGLAIGALIAILRPIASKLFESKEAAHIPAPIQTAVLNVAGLSVLAGLAIWWISLVYRFALKPTISSQAMEALDFGAGYYVAFSILFAAVGYMIATGPNVDFINRSSLHPFYKSRLIRSYLGAANPSRFVPPVDGSKTIDSSEHPLLESDVADVHENDDVLMQSYRPHLAGGPVHIVNVCVNESRDPRGQLFNQDRKGRLLSIAPGGLYRFGVDPWVESGATDASTLGHWMGISGAAVSPGLGNRTSSGLAALLTILGVRLGYWWDSSTAKFEFPRAAAAPVRRLKKYRSLVREVLGNFVIRKDMPWYLSDGGHFENTGAYALLREESELVVIIDCGADPTYGFADLENLVRKARIDLNAQITFLKPSDKAAKNIKDIFGSLSELASPLSHTCLALANVTYRSKSHEGKTKEGRIILVKPNVCQNLPVDLVNFKASFPAFPQQSTADQFFDEAQWESYFRLGEYLGHKLSTVLDEKLHISEDFISDEGLDILATATAAKASEAVATAAEAARQADSGATSRLPARVSASPVSATIGLGVIVSLGVTLWQGFESRRAEHSATRAAEIAALDALGKSYRAVDLSKPETVSELAGQLSHVADTQCRIGTQDWFVRSPVAQRILSDARSCCSALRVIDSKAAQRACEWFESDESNIDCLDAGRRVPVGHYWGRDYFVGDQRSPDQVPLCDAALVVTAAKDKAVKDLAVAKSAVAVAENRQSAERDPAKKIAQELVVKQAQEKAETAERELAQISVPKVCARKTVYIQIFGNDRRDEVRAFREPWKNFGASVPAIEDVLATARDRNSRPPAVVDEVTAIYHTADDHLCANQVLANIREGAHVSGDAVAKAPKPLPRTLRGTPGVIEIWFPRKK